jgi:hypothetical protein
MDITQNKWLNMIIIIIITSYYMDASVLPGNIPLIELIQNYILVVSDIF